MSKINQIQKAIIELEGGAFQKLFDDYLIRKYNYNNFHPLGVQEGTNKTTKGIPDSYAITEDGQYILIMYGSVKKDAYNKLKKDILSCYNEAISVIDKSRIHKIIAGHISTNITIEQSEKLKNLISDVDVKLIGLDQLSHDLYANYPFVIKDHLNINIDTNQIFSIEQFIKTHDFSQTNAPLNMDFFYRETEIKN